MKSSQKLIITISALFIFSYFTSYAQQTITMGSASSVTTCSANFYDSGGASGSYSNNENSTLTIYPQLVGGKIQINLMEVNLGSNDILSIYDGINVAAPVLSSNNYSTGIFWANNASGALTIRFVSNATFTFSGWKAQVYCISPSFPHVNLDGNISLTTCEGSLFDSGGPSMVVGSNGINNDTITIFPAVAGNKIAVKFYESYGDFFNFYNGPGTSENLPFNNISSSSSTNIRSTHPTGAVTIVTKGYSNQNWYADIYCQSPNTAPQCANLDYPYENETNVSMNTVLHWNNFGLGTPELYDVYFGTNPNPPLLASDLTSNSFHPGTLSPSTTYYWKVITKNTAGNSTGCITRQFNTSSVYTQTSLAGQTINACSLQLNNGIQTGSITVVPPAGQISYLSFYIYDLYLGIGDTLYVYNGNSTAAPLQGIYTSYPYDPSGIINIFSTAADGSLTLKFTSNYDNSLSDFSLNFSCFDPNSAPACPSNSEPYDGQTDVLTTSSLSWLYTISGQGLPDVYDVYFGTDPTPTLVSQNQTSLSYTPSNLQLNTTYYWMIIAKNQFGESTGCWTSSFTTIQTMPYIDIDPYSASVIQGDGIDLSYSGAGVAEINFSYSTDGGNTFQPFDFNIPFTNSYVWVPIPPAGSVVIMAQDASNPSIFDTISIDVTPLNLTINYPINGEEFLFNDDFNVEWESNQPINQPSFNNVNLSVKEISALNWSDFFIYNAGNLNTTNQINYFNSLASAPIGLTTGNYLLKIEPFYGNGDITTVPFSIKDILILNPNGSEVFIPGSIVSIQAQSYINDTYILQFSSNGGATWSNLTNSFVIDLSNGTYTQFDWTVPSINSTNCYLRLIKASNPGIVYDQTNAPFTIQCNVSANINPSGPVTFCQGQSVQLNANTGVGYTYQWKLNNITISGATNASHVATATGSYTVVVTANGCSATSSAINVTVNNNPSSPILSVINNCGTSTITATGVTGSLTWSDGGSGNPRTVSSGTYTVVQTSNGCTSATSNSVTANPNIIPNAPLLSIINNCGNSTITATGVTGTLTWSDGGTGNPRTVSSGTYTVVQTSNGCTSSNSNAVTANPNIIPNAPLLSIINNCGNSTITATGVTGSLTWSDGGSGNPRTVISGTYTVTQSSNGCTSATSNSVTANPNIIPNAPVLSVINNCGTSTITATGVTGTLTWSDGGSGNPRTVSSGTYTVTQTSNGCTSATSNSVTANPTAIPNAPVLSVINNCGTSTITATGVTGTLTWSDGGSGNPRTVSSGTYTVTQTSNGCTSASSNSVTANPSAVPNAPVLSVINNCGTSTITATGVTGTLTWSDGGTGNPRTVSSGTYTVTQTSNGCTSASSNSVTANPTAVPNAPVLSVINNCGTSTITATGVTGTLMWSDGGSGNPRTVSSGTYTVVQTSNGCTSASSNSVTSNPNIIPNAPLLSVINNCGTSTITATGVTGTLTWSDGGTGNPRTLSAGTYTVTQTANGCTSGISNSVIANPNSFPNTSLISGSVSPQCNGTGIVYNVVLQSGSNYLWQVPVGATIVAGNSGPNNNSITVNFGSTSGFVTVTETNVNGCIGAPQTLGVLLQGCGLSANFAANSTSVCSGNTLTFTNLSTGISANTTYNWNFGANANPATANGPGPHIVEYNGAGASTVSLIITEGASSTFTQTNYITINPIPTAPLLSIVNNCNSSEITASGFTGTLNWNDGGSGNPRIVIAGNFSVTQTVNGCQSANSNVVSANPLGLPSTPVLSVVNNCGNATITATNTSGILTWSDGGSGNPRTVTSGTFTVFQTVSGCASANSNAVIASPFSVPNTSIINGNQTPGCLASGVNYSVSLTQGSTYAWTVPPGALITSGNNGVNNNSIIVDFGNINGNISVIETTSDNCVGAMQTLAITMQGCGLTAGFMVNNTSICSGNDILFSNISTGTTGATTYLWNFGANAIPSTATGPGPHLVTYVGSGLSTASLTINDGINSTYTLPDPISVNVNPAASITVNGSATICAGDSVQLSANAGLGYTYEWRLNNAILSNAINADFYANSGGFYKVAISVNGCTTISDSILINYLNVPTMPIITLNANQLSSNYPNSNQWFLDGVLLPNDTLSFINISANGNYSVCYTNSNGCSACSDPFVITNLNYISNQNGFIVYPNPVNDVLYIKNISNSNQLVNVELYDNTGKMVYFNIGFNTSDEIKLTDLAKGIYFLKITDEDDRISYLKLVK